jgi:hypothetical protein
MKDKIAGAKRPRSFTFITTRSHRDNIKQLAVTNDMNMTEFIVKVLTEKMAQELQEKTIVEVHNN